MGSQAKNKYHFIWSIWSIILIVLSFGIGSEIYSRMTSNTTNPQQGGLPSVLSPDEVKQMGLSLPPDFSKPVNFNAPQGGIYDAQGNFNGVGLALPPDFSGEGRNQAPGYSGGFLERLGQIPANVAYETKKMLGDSTPEILPNPQQLEIDSLKQEVEILKNRKPQTIIKEIPAKDTFDYSATVAEWQDRVAEVNCFWMYNGTVYKQNRASGLLVIFGGQVGTSLLTNQHVVLDANNNIPTWCIVGVYGRGERMIMGRTVDFNPNDNPFVLGGSITQSDWAFIKLANKYNSLSSYYPNTDSGFFDQIGAAGSNWTCKEGADIGDKIIVLGYPAIGTAGGITVTEGIISGLEGDYYVTSAKIDHGNSGGAAISIKGDCYLGIPTWVEHQNGGFESLGRILKSSSFLAGN